MFKLIKKLTPQRKKQTINILMPFYCSAVAVITLSVSPSSKKGMTIPSMPAEGVFFANEQIRSKVNGISTLTASVNDFFANSILSQQKYKRFAYIFHTAPIGGFKTSPTLLKFWLDCIRRCFAGLQSCGVGFLTNRKGKNKMNESPLKPPQVSKLARPNRFRGSRKTAPKLGDNLSRLLERNYRDVKEIA